MSAAVPFLEFPVAVLNGGKAPGVAARVEPQDGGARLQLRFHESGDAWPEAMDGVRFFVAVEVPGANGGSVVVPYGRHGFGSTFYLPFQAGALYWLDASAGGEGGAVRRRVWEGWCWSADEVFEGGREQGGVSIPLPEGGERFVVYVKDMRENDGWGRLLMVSGRLASATLEASRGLGDFYAPSALKVAGDASSPGIVEVFREPRKVYQIFPRLFNNTKKNPKPNGTRAENGCGTWNGITEEAIDSLRGLGITDLWLTGVLQHATGTAYPGLPADPPDLLKGVAGSPYAIKNPFDLSPECAVDPARRLEEFRALLGRIHRAGLRAIIDFVPNHLARCFVRRPHAGPRDLDIGATDETNRFFSPRNCFYYMEGGVRLPTVDEAGGPQTVTCRVLGGCTGRFEREKYYSLVTGNNVASPAPGADDWYETVKLNYGYQFQTGERRYPSTGAPEEAVPPVWHLMDAALAYWQEQGVDGFRCDMAHMVPPEFWRWAIARARQRGRVFFVAEAYNGDPMRVPTGDPVLASLYDGHGHVGINLVDAGFDAIYDGDIYKRLKDIYDGVSWANDLDGCVCHAPFLTAHSLRYGENHDEVRLTHPESWGGIGMNVGRPVCGILFGLPGGGQMLYNGQEVGEEGELAGYGGGNGRTTIFDYWIMPRMQQWMNGGRYDGGGLAADRRALRETYGRLLMLASRPAFQRGLFLPLNGANLQSHNFGRLPGEAASGHWMYAFLRYDPGSGERFLVVVNLHAQAAFRDVQVVIPEESRALAGLVPGARLRLEDRLSSRPPLVLISGSDEIELPVVPPLSAYYFEVTPVS